MNERDKKELLEKRIAALSPEKKALLEQQLNKQKNNYFNQKESQKSTISLAQERLWFLDRLEPNSPIYNIAFAWQFKGNLDIKITQKTFNHIVARHDSLRTNFIVSKTGKPEVVIKNNASLNIPVTELNSLENNQNYINNLTHKIARNFFDLATELPIKINIIKQDTDNIKIVIVLHHIVADGWSRGILLKEFVALYNSYLNNIPLLPNSVIQYSEFAAKQKHWLKGKEYQQQLSYWKQKLVNLEVLELPTDLPRPPQQSFQGKTLFFTLNSDITTQLKALSRQQSATLFMSLLTAFKILLHRYSEQDEITIGSPIANRNWQKIENTIGFFVNTLVLRSNLSNNPTFTELLTQIKQTTTEAYQNQDVPYAKLVDELQPDRNLSQNTLFSVMFQFQNQAYQWQNSQTPELAIPNLKLTQEWIDLGVTKFDLSWHLIERDETITVAIEYSTNLYHDATIERMFGHYQTLLLDIIKNPQQRVSNLSLLTAAERKKILIDWNQTQVDFPLDRCFYQLFEKQVTKTPNNIVVEDSERNTLTYTELNNKANLLAQYLIERGVKIETRVGICLDRSLDLIISLLAVQKSGGTYIPLDTNYPQERINYIIEDSDLQLVLTQTKYASNFANKNITIVDLCKGVSRNAPTSSATRYSLPVTHPNNLAYIIYTSGSTGKPKGTMITHRGLTNYLCWASNRYTVAEGKGVPVQSSISFDATITSLYTALLKGQKLVLFAEDNELETLSKVLNSDADYSLIKLTPAHLDAVNKLTKTNSKSKPTRTFVIGGEALASNTVNNWQKRTPETTLVNEYGPTETVVGCCTYEITQQTKISNTIPIGKPIANSQLYILDRYLQPTPIGIPGELYIGGCGVARGYLQQPKLTAEKFIPNPFCEASHKGLASASRQKVALKNTALHKGRSQKSVTRYPLPVTLYKTGDRARYLSDGNIEYLGRIDNQIKIRGFRIELGEIKVILDCHSQVKSSLIIAKDERLIAYVVTKDKSLESKTLRKYLKQKLPSYMIPNNFVILDRFPLTVNGKIDRQALPQPNVREKTKALVKPQTEKEAILLKIWQQVLNLEQIGIEDNFFELGGDSIISIQIISRAKQQGLTFTPKQLFQNQTIAELAAVAEFGNGLKISQNRVIGEVPLTPIQHWFFEQKLYNYNHYNQSVLLEVNSGLNFNYLKLALQYILEHHDALRMSFQPTNEGWQQFNREDITEISFTEIDLSYYSDEEVITEIKTIAQDLQSSLNITQGKLITGALFRLDKIVDDRLLLIIHHLIIDGVSWRILLEDLVTVYQQLQLAKQVKFPLKTNSYQTWSNKLLDYAKKNNTVQELNYWSQLASNKVESLPIDKSDRAKDNTVASIQKVTITLNEQQTNKLLTELPKTYNTNIEDALLTALIQSFYMWNNDTELLIALENYGRKIELETIDISRTVGWFTNIYPVLLKINLAKKISENLTSTKEQLRAIPNRGFNYDILRYLNSETSQQLQQLLSPQVSFNYLGKIQLGNKQSFIKGLATEDIGSNSDSFNVRKYLIDIVSFVEAKRLQIDFFYSNNIHDRSTIEKLADNFLKALNNLIQSSSSSKEKKHTASDFSAAKINQNQLSKLMKQIKKKK